MRAGVATDDEIDALEATLRTAENGDYAWVSSPFYLALTLRTRAAES
ncbi:MAG: hypothetical protein M3459_00530 [Actinomycetota bacterium]|nr:hypothetical protein [Actinomycetota bacterium]